MQVSLIVLRQTATMFLLMAVGFALYKAKKIDEPGSRSIASALLYAVMPATLINSLLLERTPANTALLVRSTLAAAAAMLLSVAAARLFYRKSGVEAFAAAFSNAGFVGIPLVQAAFGADASFCIVGYMVLLCFLQYTYGVALLTGEKLSFSPASLAKNPVIWGTAMGLVLYFSGLSCSLPSLFTGLLSSLAGLNAPLGMILLGVYLAQSELGTTFTTLRLYGLCAVRLVLIPLLTAGLLFLLPLDHELKLCLLIASAAPVGAGAATYAQLFGGNYRYAGQAVALSSLLSVATLPLVLMAASLFL